VCYTLIRGAVKVKKLIEYLKKYIAEEKRISTIENIILSNIDYSITITDKEAITIEEILLKKGSDKSV
jgi:hypothetical protein